MWNSFNWQLQLQVAFFDKSITFLIANRIFGANFGDCNLIFSIYAHNICCHYVCMICQSKQLPSTRYSSFLSPLSIRASQKEKKKESEKCRYLFISLLAFRWQQKR